MLGKVIKRTAQSAGALTLAFEVALFNMPDLVSSPVEEYMKDNEIPLELIKGVRTDNMRIYDEHSHLSALHLASFLFWNNAKNMDFLWAYVDPIRSIPFMYGDMASLHAANGKCMVYMPDLDRNVDEMISLSSGIPKDDLELSQKIIDTFRANILIHEIGHAQPLAMNEQEYCERSQIPTYKKSAYYSKHVLPLYMELRSDDFSLERMNDSDVSDYIIAFRAVTEFNKTSNVSHDTSLFLDEWFNKKNMSIRSEIPDYQKNKEQLISILTPYIERYSYEQVKPYQIYKAALDFLDDEKVSGEVPYSLRRITELFIEGVEYLAPTKANELRMDRSRQKPSSEIDLSV